MRTIKYIVLHCTATQPSATVKSIQNYWKNTLKWKNPGYHFLIEANGKVNSLLPIEQVSNGVAGFNSNSIHISYIGGIDKKGFPKDTRTPDQVSAQIQLIKDLKLKFPNAEILGHRDFPGVTKACPSFDVREWLKCVHLN